MDKFLNELLEIFEHCPCDDSEICDLCYSLPPYFQSASGETRVAIWHDSWDFVIKIPRYGYTEDDYCDIECQHYESAKAYGVERICLPIEFLTTNHYGLSFYKQARYTTDSSTAFRERNYDRYLNKRNLPLTGRGTLTRKITDAAYDGCRINEKWMARVLQLYGKKFCRSFEAWTQENKINDLHDCNTGWLNNKPVLLDYAGYHE